MRGIWSFAVTKSPKHSEPAASVNKELAGELGRIQFGGSAKTHRKDDLEDHMQILHELDEQRRRSAQLRDIGLKEFEKAFVLWLEAEIENSDATEAELAAERLHLLKDPFLSAVDCFNRHGHGSIDTFNILVKTDLMDITRTIQIKESFLTSLSGSVERAAMFLLAYVATPGMAYSKESLLCYYYIIRELYTSDAPDWTIGGARALLRHHIESSPNKESPYVTALCVKAVLGFIECQEASTRYVACVRAYLEQVELIEDDALIPADWKTCERARISYSYSISLEKLEKQLVYFSKKLSINPTDTKQAVGNKLGPIIKKAASETERAFKEALDDIDKFWTEEFVELKNKLKKDGLDENHIEDRIKKERTRRQFGHERARGAIFDGKKIAEQVKKKLDGADGPAFETSYIKGVFAFFSG